MFTRALCILFFSLSFPAFLSADELLLDDEEIFQYSKFLYHSQEYYRAITESKRLQFYFPDSKYINESKLLIGKSLMAGGELKKSIRYWSNTISQIREKEYQLQVYELLGLSWLDLNSHEVFELREPFLKQAQINFAKLDGGFFRYRNYNHFNQKLFQRVKEEYKNPWIAGAMSALVPGSGSAYADEWREGIYAFFITGLFYWATLDSIKKEDKGLTYFFGFFTLSFYGGSIYAASNSVHHYNNELEEQRITNLRKKYNVYFIP